MSRNELLVESRFTEIFYSQNHEELDEKNEITGNTLKITQKIFSFVEASLESKEKSFYKTPTLRQFYDDEEEFLESWKELFFDLIYVAMAFKLGDVISENITEPTLILYVFGQFCPMYAVWYARTILLSQFSTVDSHFHIFIDVIHALTVAFMALFIGTPNQIKNGLKFNLCPPEILTTDSPAPSPPTNSFFSFLPFFAEEVPIGTFCETDESGSRLKPKDGFNIILAFSVTFFICQLIELLRCLEMRFRVPYHGLNKNPSTLGEEEQDERVLKQQQAIRSTANTGILKNTLSMLCTLSAICISATSADPSKASHKRVNLILFFLILAFFVSTFFHLCKRIYYKYYKKEILIEVPINVNFVIRRMGEFTMLLIGEGVLQIIIILAISENFIIHFEYFALSFFVLTLLHFIAFYLIPYEVEHHAFKSTSPRALILNLTLPFSNVSLIFVGVSLKLLLKQEVQGSELVDRDNGDEEEQDPSLSNMFALSLFICCCCLIFQKFIHTGHHNIFRKDSSKEGRKNNNLTNLNTQRILFSLLYFLTPILFLNIKLVDHFETLLIAILIQSLIIILGRVNETFFDSVLIKKENEKALSLISLKPRHYIVSSEGPAKTGSKKSKKSHYVSSAAHVEDVLGGRLRASDRNEVFSKVHLTNLYSYLNKRTKQILRKIHEAKEDEDFIEDEEKIKALLKNSKEIEQVTQVINKYLKTVLDAKIMNSDEILTQTTL